MAVPDKPLLSVKCFRFTLLFILEFMPYNHLHANLQFTSESRAALEKEDVLAVPQLDQWTLGQNSGLSGFFPRPTYPGRYVGLGISSEHPYWALGARHWAASVRQAGDWQAERTAR